LKKEEKYIYDESREDLFELLEYSAIIINHLHLENRTQYFELIEQFLNGPIDFLDLRNKHQSINDAGKHLQLELILLEPNEKYEGFDDLIDELVSLFDRYYPDPTVWEDYEFSEDELKKFNSKYFHRNERSLSLKF
jgi:hypothetical protein